MIKYLLHPHRLLRRKSHKLLAKLALGIWALFLSVPLVTAAADSRFKDTLDQSIGNAQLNQNLPQKFQKYDPFKSAQLGIGARDFFIFIGLQIIIPVFVFVGILFALIGFYKMMTANWEEEGKKWANYLMRGVVGTLLMVSAAYIIWLLTWTEGSGGIIGTMWQSSDPNMSWVELAQNLYQQLMFPALKLMMYLGLGLLFIILLTGAFKYLFGGGDEAQKSGQSILIYTSVGILIIILAKTLVEVSYGKYADVVNKNNELKNLGLIGKWWLAETNLGVFYTIINWLIGLWTFFIIVILVYQAYLLLTNPSDEGTLKKIQSNFIYIFIGILILWAAYLVVNFFIIN